MKVWKNILKAKMKHVKGFRLINEQLFKERPLLPLEVKHRWLEALRGGNYRQGLRYLKATHNKIDSYCCLGVLCNLEGREPDEIKPEENTQICIYSGLMGSLPEDIKVYNVLGYAGFFQGFCVEQFSSLAELNDCGYSFEAIAEVIEKYF